MDDKKLAWQKFLLISFTYIITSLFLKIGHGLLFSIIDPARNTPIVQEISIYHLIIFLYPLMVSSLWKVQRTEVLMMLSGEILVLSGLYYNVYLTKILLFVIEAGGVTLILIGMIRFVLFVISKRSDQFIIDNYNKYSKKKNSSTRQIEEINQ